MAYLEIENTKCIYRLCLILLFSIQYHAGPREEIVQKIDRFYFIWLRRIGAQPLKLRQERFCMTLPVFSDRTSQEPRKQTKARFMIEPPVNASSSTYYTVYWIVLSTPISWITCLAMHFTAELDMRME